MAVHCVDCGRAIDFAGNPMIGHEEDNTPLCYDCAEDRNREWGAILDAAYDEVRRDWPNIVARVEAKRKQMN